MQHRVLYRDGGEIRATNYDTYEPIDGKAYVFFNERQEPVALVDKRFIEDIDANSRDC